MHPTPPGTPQPPREALMTSQTTRLDSVDDAPRRDDMFGSEEES